MPSLTYSPSTGHVKLDGAVVGIISKKGRDHVFIRYEFASVVSCKASRLDLLLPKIRKVLIDD
jgi:hypothetical protein